MKVRIIEHTPNPEKVIAMAGKLCYSPSTIDELEDNLDDKEIEKFTNMLIGLGHLSTVEHVSFTFAIEGISKVTSHQLVRHRLASYSMKSQRYVKHDGFEYIIPHSLDNDDTRKQYEDLMFKINEYYNFFTDYLIQQGKTEKQAIEDARYVFPNACETKIIVTMNLRNLLHFFNERCCSRSQTEIREMAYEMLRQCKEVSPILFKNAGAKCVKLGYCPEGKMSCGRIKK